MPPTVILNSNDYDNALHKAVACLTEGGILAYPTETFYGLGVKYDDEKALLRLYDMKRRPREKTLPIIIGSAEQLSILAASVGETASSLMRKFWPGPLTLVFNAQRGLNGYITCDDKIAVRIPGESFALDLVRKAAFPITATSANISGLPASNSAAMISEYFDDIIDLVIDGGTLRGSAPSTIVDVTGTTAVILREGAISASRIFSCL